jgi:hypothetical protein
LFSGREPEQDDLQILRRRLGNESVEKGKIELASMGSTCPRLWAR